MNELPAELLQHIASYIGNYPIIVGISKYIDSVLEDPLVYACGIFKHSLIHGFNVSQLIKYPILLEYAINKNIIPYDKAETYLIKKNYYYLQDIIDYYSPSLTKTVMKLELFNKDYSDYIANDIVCELTKPPYKYHRIAVIYSIVKNRIYKGEEILTYLLYNCKHVYTKQLVLIITTLCTYDSSLYKHIPQVIVEYIHELYKILPHDDCIPISRRTRIYSPLIDISYKPSTRYRFCSGSPF